jgi:putative ATP-dependent endonuclease of OLD family
VRISRIVFRNHRVVPDLDVDVRGHLVLVGPNASGKTSVLRALDVALGGTYGQLIGAFPPDALRDPGVPLEIEVHFDGFDDADRAAFPDEINVIEPDAEDEAEPEQGGDDSGSQGDPEPLEAAGDGEPSPPEDEGADTSGGESESDSGTEGSGGAGPSESLTLVVTVVYDDEEPQVTRVFRKPGEDRRVRPQHVDAIGWGYLPATRSPDRELGAGRKSALKMLVAAIDLGATKDQLVKLLTDANEAIDKAKTVVDLRTTLASELTGLLPRQVDPGDLSVQVTSTADIDPAAEAQVRLRDHTGEPAPLHHQSDGLRALSTIVVQRLATPAAVLAVDEPEIHLHPRSQARLGSILAAGAGQRVVATHSSSVLASFAPTDVVALVGSATRQLTADKVAEDPKFFARWWNDASLEPLTARRVVLVEGPSDKILLKCVAALLGQDLDRTDCSVVVANGANGFAPLLKLYGADGFGLDIIGLVDLAETPKVAKELGVDNTPAALGAAGWHISTPDLEGECITGLGVPRHVALMSESGLYTERQILGSLGAADTAAIDEAAYAAWCRADKIRHAVALSAAMEASDATAIASLAGLVAAAARR